MLNEKINDIDQKMLWEESVRTCKRVRNSMATTGSTTSSLNIYMDRNQISLISYQSLDALDISLNSTKIKEENYRQNIQCNHVWIYIQPYEGQVQVAQP